MEGSKVKPQKEISGIEIMSVNIFNHPGHKICKKVKSKQFIQEISSAPLFAVIITFR